MPAGTGMNDGWNRDEWWLGHVWMMIGKWPLPINLMGTWKPTTFGIWTTRIKHWTYLHRYLHIYCRLLYVNHQHIDMEDALSKRVGACQRQSRVTVTNTKSCHQNLQKNSSKKFAKNLAFGSAIIYTKKACFWRRSGKLLSYQVISAENCHRSDGGEGSSPVFCFVSE